MAESNGSQGNIMMDSDDDGLHGYPMPVPMGWNLFIHASLFGSLVSPVCPNRMPCGWNKVDARAYVLLKACGR